MAKRKEITEVLTVNYRERGTLYTRVQGFILFVLGLVGLRYFLPFIGIEITPETIRFVFFIGFIAAGIIGSSSLFFNGLGRLISGRVEE